jgi:HEAT repeat protein
MAAALAAYDQDCRWELIDGIVQECSDDVLEASVKLLQGDSARRTLGADVLGRLADIEPAVRDAAKQGLLHALDREAETGPLASIVAALGHMADPDAVARIVPLAYHPDPEVRLAVAFTIAAISPPPLAPASRAVLIRLSCDADPEVRDWATFGLGTLCNVDGPDIRDALLDRAEDTYSEARAEALFGLAVRQDPRAVPHLIRALQSASVGGLEVDAAAEAADPRLLPSLLALKLKGHSDDLRVRRAIDRCSGRDRPPTA